MINKFQHWLLFLLLPLSQVKSIFYSSNKKVDWYLFSNHKRYLCNVVEDYSNIIIFGVVFYLLAFCEITDKTKKVALFLFIINVLDLVHLGLLDMQYLVIVKFIAAFIVYYFYEKRFKIKYYITSIINLIYDAIKKFI